MSKFKRVYARRISKSEEQGETDTDVNSKVIEQFRGFALELETKQDRYERILKISRDITIESKRLIFFLHTFKKDTPEGSKVLNGAEKRLDDLVKNQFRRIILELYQHDFHQYLRSYSFGVQEFIEAFSFYHYLKYERLLTYATVKNLFKVLLGSTLPQNISSSEDQDTNALNDQNTLVHFDSLQTNFMDLLDKNCFITMMDYVLGLNDLTGELMRYCINQVSSGEIKTAFDISEFLANLYTGMISVGCNNREFQRKMWTAIQSVKKVETACYTVQIRGSEIPKHMIMNVLENEENNEDDVHF